MHVKVLSWNIWVDGDFEKIKNFLLTAHADIVGLQEVKNDDLGRKVIPFMESLGYQSSFMPVEKSWGGSTFHDGPAIFSTYEILSTEKYLLSKEKTRGALRADIKIGDTVIHVFSTHLLHTHQEQSDVQDEQARNLLAALPTEKVIVMGDFNATPASSVVRQMTSLLVNTAPDNEPTWSLYPEGCPKCNPQGIDVRLDYIFASKDLKTHSPKVEESKASDHLPISVIIEI